MLVTAEGGKNGSGDRDKYSHENCADSVNERRGLFPESPGMKDQHVAEVCHQHDSQPGRESKQVATIGQQGISRNDTSEVQRIQTKVCEAADCSTVAKGSGHEMSRGLKTPRICSVVIL